MKEVIVPKMATPNIKLPNDVRFRWEFLKWQVETNNFKTGAELGIWKGKTFLYLLEHCLDLTLIGVDAWQPQPDNTGLETWEDWPHQENETHVRDNSAKYGDRAIIYKMFTNDAALTIRDQSLDFVFIDADHGTDGVLNDIRNWKDKINDTGYIYGHDINWPTVRTAVEQCFNKFEIGPDNVWSCKKDWLKI